MVGEVIDPFTCHKWRVKEMTVLDNFLIVLETRMESMTVNIDKMQESFAEVRFTVPLS